MAVPQLDERIIRDLSRVYGSLTERIIKRLYTPPRRLYVRVNTLRATRNEILELFKREGIVAYPDEYVEDAVYFEVKGPFNVECPASGRIIVDSRTAVSLMLGADLYRPGVLQSDYFRKGDLLLAITREGALAACVKTAVSYSDMLNMTRGLVGINVSSPYKAPKITETYVYARGLIYSQSLPSIITSHILNPRAGELIVDMNAAPGGKTSHIVQLSRGRARVLAIDRSISKILELRSTLSRLQLDVNVMAIPWDSRYLHLDLNLHGKVSKVLIDPPCSNLGVRPLVESKKWSVVVNLSEYQKQFLKAAKELLKPGGLLVYSTCTITFKENEENIVYAIEELGFSSSELEVNVPYAERVCYKDMVAYRYSPLLNDMPGYFIAILVK
ncbi:MAG: RNA methyltransferase [Desulfurococcaceae archaeon]|nr:RNA methyltransferase [Desulfurococcaceae archaeon]